VFGARLPNMPSRGELAGEKRIRKVGCRGGSVGEQMSALAVGSDGGKQVAVKDRRMPTAFRQERHPSGGKTKKSQQGLDRECD